MKVLVTGATGFVGQEVLRQLHGAGHEIVVLSRASGSRTVRELADRWRAEIKSGDVLDPHRVHKAAVGVDAVIHLVGIIAELGRDTFENAHHQATGNVLRAAEETGVKRYLHMSALGTRPRAPARYHQSKWAAEELVRGSRLDWTILRPSLIYGPGDRFVNLFAEISRRSPVLPVLGSGLARLQPVSVTDVATCFSRGLTEPRAVGQTYDVCGREALTFLEILDTILAVTGRKRMKFRLPLPLARVQARLLEWFYPRLLGKAAPLNRDQIVMLQEDNTGDFRPAAEMFGLKLGPFREGIADFLARRSR